jgi:hypothetical protein
MFSGGEYTVFHRAFALLDPVSPFGSLDSVELATTYIADTELQWQRFRDTYGNRLRFTTWRSEELFTVGGATRFLLHLGLGPVNVRCMRIIANARPVNQHVSWKGPQMLSVPPAAFLARVQRLRQRYADAGVPFPALPQLAPAAPCANITALRTSPEGAVYGYTAATPVQLLHPDAPDGLQPLAEGDVRLASRDLWCSLPEPVLSAADVARYAAVEVPNNTPPHPGAKP